MQSGPRICCLFLFATTSMETRLQRQIWIDNEELYPTWSPPPYFSKANHSWVLVWALILYFLHGSREGVRFVTEIKRNESSEKKVFFVVVLLFVRFEEWEVTTLSILSLTFTYKHVQQNLLHMTGRFSITLSVFSPAASPWDTCFTFLHSHFTGLARSHFRDSLSAAAASAWNICHSTL